jgi:xanthine dehydrogenase accessory factor
MDEVLEKLVECNQRGKPVCLCVVVKTEGAVPRHAGSKMLVFPDGKTLGTVGGGGVEAEVTQTALDALRNGKPAMLHYSLKAEDESSVGVCGGEVDIYLEPFLAKPKLLIIGAGHVGKSVAKFGKLLGFQVLVSDDRAELCTQEEFPEANLLLPTPMQMIPEQVEIDPHTYIVIVTRGSEVDVDGLPALLKTQPAYIGLIGSRRRWETTHQALLAQGINNADLQRIKCPIGLDIHAETPDEIAFSILAEIIAVKNTPKVASLA